MESYWSPNPMADAFIRKGATAYRHTDPLGRTSHDNRGRVWSDASTRQGTPRIAGQHQELGQEGFFSRAFRGSMSLKHLDFRFSLQNCKRINFCCFKPLGMWCFVATAPRN